VGEDGSGPRGQPALEAEVRFEVAMLTGAEGAFPVRTAAVRRHESRSTPTKADTALAKAMPSSDRSMDPNRSARQ
jgi:hypothetical protein